MKNSSSSHFLSPFLFLLPMWSLANCNWSIRQQENDCSDSLRWLRNTFPFLFFSSLFFICQPFLCLFSFNFTFPVSYSPVISCSKSTFDRDVQIRKSMRQSGGHEHQIGSGVGPKEVAIDVHITPKPSQIQQQVGKWVVRNFTRIKNQIIIIIILSLNQNVLSFLLCC